MRHHSRKPRRKAVISLTPASARFNTLFEISTQHYTHSTRPLLRRPGRYMVVYLLICAGMAVLFLRTPTSSYQKSIRNR
ncbi:efflux RND transporter permease subunit [Shigella flexneri]